MLPRKDKKTNRAVRQKIHTVSRHSETFTAHKSTEKREHKLC